MFRIQVWIATVLVSVGITGAVIYSLPPSIESHEKSNKPPAVTKLDPNEDAIKGKPSMSVETSIDEANVFQKTTIELATDHIAQGDQYLLAGNYLGAQQAYVKATNTFHGNPPSTLLFRLAMAAEQLEDSDNADTLYQKSVRRSDSGSAIRLMSLTGVARAWQNQGRLEQAKQLLSELFLRYSTVQTIPAEIKEQITYQLGSTVQKQLLKNLPSPVSQMESIEFMWCGPSIDAMLDIVRSEQNSTKENQQSTQSSEPVWSVLQRPSSDLNLIAVDTTTDLIPISQILSQYSRLANIQFDMPIDAKRTLNNRSARLDISGMSLALVLDQLLNPNGFVWAQTGDQVQIKKIKSLTDGRSTYGFNQVKRLLRRIELTFPKGIKRNTSLLHRGNFSFLETDLTEADNQYLKLDKLLIADELAAKLSFNRALVEIENKQTEEAIRRFFFSVDQSLDQSLQAKGYAWIGRLELQLGRSDRAAYALSRGLALAENPEVRQDALMNLAKSYLLESDPFSANRVLFNNENVVIDSSQRRLAGVLSAYARFLGMVPSDGLRNEGERLVVALASIVPEDTKTFVDQLLVGRAFYEVGFVTKSNTLLELALKNAPHEHWRRKVAFELASNLHRSGELDLAEKSFKSVLSQDGSETTRLAQIGLAKIAMKKKEPEKCLDICKALYNQDLTKDQKKQMLSMMGESYRLQGRHEIAAICFSGTIPQEFAASSTVHISTKADRPRDLSTTIKNSD